MRTTRPDGKTSGWFWRGLSEQDLEVLKDWTARYRDIPLPSQERISRVVDKALVNTSSRQTTGNGCMPRSNLRCPCWRTIQSRWMWRSAVDVALSD